MALNDSATLVVGSGNYLLAPVGTAIPEDLTAPTGLWTNLGHTSIEDIIAFSSEGGEATVLGSLQNPNLRTSYSARTESFQITLQQFDEEALKLYFGQNMVEVDGGRFLGVNTSPAPTQAAYLAVFLDGQNVFAVYAPKVEIFRGDDLELPDTESLASLPLNVTPLVQGSNSWAYAITPMGNVEATVATAGNPGSFNGAAPANFASLNSSSIVADPTSAWTPGQHVLLGDASKAHWDGSDWATDEAE